MKPSLDFMPLAYLIIGLSISLGPKIFSKGSLNSDSMERFVYRYPSGIIHTYLAFSVLAAMGAAFFHGDQSLNNRPNFVALSLVFVLGFLYSNFYRIVVERSGITYGAVIKTKIPFARVVRMTYSSLGRVSYVKLYDSRGLIHSFEKGVYDFDGFAKMFTR